jgi:hypothetical protein
MFIVILENMGNKFFLRSTVWASAQDRATQFDSMEAAQAGLLKAKQFMKAAMYKKAMIVSI